MTTLLVSNPETLAAKVGSALFNACKCKSECALGASKAAEKKPRNPATIKKIASSMFLFARLYSSIAVRLQNGEEIDPAAITALSAHEAGCVTGGMPAPDPAQSSNEGNEGVARRGSFDNDDAGGFACGADGGGSDEDACGTDACAVDAGGATDGSDADPFGADLAAGIDIDLGG